ncbi:MAG: methylated-DNA--[protein]-cysteine S-methyltransferase, partial [Chitinispirillia bacterium]|nr:methylated-DNA--[protein]-cysteine S-methyltransferase [Chitinispirillia bacterium]
GGNNLIGLWIEGQKYHGNTLFKQIIDKSDMPIFNDTKKWLDRYFAGEKPAVSELSIAPIGSDFRHRVWDILCEIPYGKVITYKEITEKIAKDLNKQKMSAQAVGGAVGHNPVSIIIPCHRVVGTNGSLTGFAGGIDKKIKLLEIEGVCLSKFFVPKTGTAL